MHQSWMLLIQCRYVEIHSLGHEAYASRFAGARIDDPGIADGIEAQFLDRLAGPQRMRRRRGVRIATYHWSVSIGSTISPVRPQRGTTIRCGFSDTSRPAASRSATTALRAA